jgi:hypothetical protein
MPARRKPGVFCLEGNWSPKLTDRSSVRPLLEALEDLGHIKFSHRDVATVGELEHYLKKWIQAGYADYKLLHLAFHGGPGGIWIGQKQVDLQELAEVLRGSCTDRIIYFGSCSTLKISSAELDAFQRPTRAKAVCGYRARVDWLESAAFELLLISALVDGHRRIDARFNELRRTYPDLVKRLKFESHPSYERIPSSAT